MIIDASETCGGSIGRQRDIFGWRIPSMRNLLDESSVAQRLDGKAV